MSQFKLYDLIEIDNNVMVIVNFINLTKNNIFYSIAISQISNTCSY